MSKITHYQFKPIGELSTMICTYYTECLLKIMKANSKIVTLCNRENWRKKCPSVKFSVAASSSLYQFQTHQLSHHKRDEVLAARKWFHHRNRKMFQRSDTVWKIQNFAITNFLHKNSVKSRVFLIGYTQYTANT